MEQEQNPRGLLKRQSSIDLTKIKATKTTDFILPLLGFTKKYYEPFLVNAYLGDVNMKGYDKDRIYIVLSNHNMNTKHMRIEDNIKNLTEFVDYYDVLDGKMSVFIVNLPEIFNNDYDHFMNGAYSKFSQEAQIAIIKGRSENSSMPHIFKKSEKLREYWENKAGSALPIDAEVWPVLQLENELFDIKKFIKN